MPATGQTISPRAVLAQLTRSGIWSAGTSASSWARRGGHVVLDADSIAAHLYRHCAETTLRHSRRAGGSPGGGCNLVNYREFARLIELVLDHLRTGLQLTPVLVYGGVHRWAGLHAHLAASGNNQQAAGSSELSKLPNLLTLNIFKSVAASQRHVKTYQAVYGAYPTMVKLARDFRCPVLTNEGDFILMDVRAGFVLFEDYFRAHHIDLGVELGSPTLSRLPSTASNASGPSVARPTSAAGRPLRGKISPSGGSGGGGGGSGGANRDQSRRPTSASSTRSTRSAKSATAPTTQQIKLRLHTHKLFLRQHPGLDHALALKLVPFTTCEFLAQHAKSVASIRVMSRELLEEPGPAKNSKQAANCGQGDARYHLSAARLECAMRFLCARTGDILPYLIRGEVARLGASHFEQDYAQLHDHYAIACDLRGHLRVLMEARGLKPDAPQLNHLQRVLVERECTADFWLSLVCGPSGASTHDFNRSLQLEDTKTLHSARAMADRPRSFALSLLGGSGSGGAGGAKRNAVLKTIDRQGQSVVERTIGAVPKPKQQEQQVLLGRVTLAQLARKSVSKQEAAAYINLAFNSRDLAKLESSELEQLLAELWAHCETKNLHKSNTGGRSPKSPALRSSSPSPSPSSRACETRNQGQLAVLLALHKYSLEQAAEGDQQFRTNYARLSRHFQIGLANHHAYQSHLQLVGEASSRPAKGTAPASNQETQRDAPEHDLRHLIELISKHDLANVICATFNEQTDLAVSPTRHQKQPVAIRSPLSPGKAPKSGSSQRSGELRKQIKHLIELFNGSLEAYTELNAFLNYPLPRPHTCYNSILLYNLILFSCQRSMGSGSLVGIGQLPDGAPDAQIYP